MLSDKVSIESAAKSLDTSVRTLQRELNRERTGFRTFTNIVQTEGRSIRCVIRTRR